MSRVYTLYIKPRHFPALFVRRSSGKGEVMQELPWLLSCCDNDILSHDYRKTPTTAVIIVKHAQPWNDVGSAPAQPRPVNRSRWETTRSKTATGNSYIHQTFHTWQSAVRCYSHLYPRDKGHKVNLIITWIIFLSIHRGQARVWGIWTKLSLSVSSILLFFFPSTFSRGG